VGEEVFLLLFEYSKSKNPHTHTGGMVYSANQVNKQLLRKKDREEAKPKKKNLGRAEKQQSRQK
jgi:hypothetical protein